MRAAATAMALGRREDRNTSKRTERVELEEGLWLDDARADGGEDDGGESGFGRVFEGGGVGEEEDGGDAVDEAGFRRGRAGHAAEPGPHQT